MNVSTSEQTLVTVAKSVGTVSQEGDTWSASNMNDMETRIDSAFNDAKTYTDNQTNSAKNYAYGLNNTTNNTITTLTTTINGRFSNTDSEIKTTRSGFEWHFEGSGTQSGGNWKVFSPSSFTSRISYATTLFAMIKVKDSNNQYYTVTKTYPLELIYDSDINKFNTFEEKTSIMNSNVFVAFEGIRSSNIFRIGVSSSTYSIEDCAVYLMGNKDTDFNI